MDLLMEHLVSNNGTAAVVDGARLLITPLQRALAPPPMCSAAADFPAPVQTCAFGQHQGNEVQLLPLLCQCAHDEQICYTTLCADVSCQVFCCLWQVSDIAM